MVQLTDTLDATTTARICADGCLVADVRAARVGIQTYLRSETEAPASFTGDRVRVYRPEDEVFHRDSMASFAAAPFTIDHPSVPVDAGNWRSLGVGEVNGDVVRDGGFVRVPVIVRDAAAVEKVRTTHKQLSAGYSCTLDWTPGTTPEGETYDAVQRNIRLNHIAAVPAARGGPALKITDERPKQEPTMKIKIGDAEVDATNGEAVRIAVDALNVKLASLEKRASDAEAKVVEHAATITARDTRITELEAALKDAEITPAKLADAAKEFADVQAKAKALGVTVAADADTTAIKKAVVDAKMGDAAKDYSADHIAIAFDALTKDAKVDPVRDALRDGFPHVANDEQAVSDARAAMIADLKGIKPAAAA